MDIAAAAAQGRCRQPDLGGRAVLNHRGPDARAGSTDGWRERARGAVARPRRSPDGERPGARGRDRCCPKGADAPSAPDAGDGGGQAQPGRATAQPPSCSPGSSGRGAVHCSRTRIDVADSRAAPPQARNLVVGNASLEPAACRFGGPGPAGRTPPAQHPPWSPSWISPRQPLPGGARRHRAAYADVPRQAPNGAGALLWWRCRRGRRFP